MNSRGTLATETPETFRSGVAARLAGIPVETLRVWERRYGVVGPRLSARGQRLYTTAEVRRLTLIKQLLDLGHSIGSIAILTTDELTALQSTVRELTAAPSGIMAEVVRELRIVLVGPLLASQRFEESLTRAASGHAVTIAGRCSGVGEATTGLRGVMADLLIIELPTLHDEAPTILARIKEFCAARQVIVLYKFAPSAIVRKLRAAGYDIARAPANAPEMASLCQGFLRLSPAMAAVTVDATAPAPPRFDQGSLAAFADASNTVYCECPRHLVELVVNLVSFERYSAECANRSPEDAILHRDLQQTAGRARALLEDALVRVATADGIPIPAPI